MQRVGVGAHYLSDVLAGAAMGVVIAEIVARAVEQKQVRF